MRAIAAMILMPALSCIAQVSARVSLSNGVELRIGVKDWERAGGNDLKVELAPASGNSFYRIFRHQSNLAVFAYEVMVSRAAGREEFQITAKPARISTRKFRTAMAASPCRRSPPRVNSRRYNLARVPKSACSKSQAAAIRSPL